MEINELLDCKGFLVSIMATYSIYIFADRYFKCVNHNYEPSQEYYCFYKNGELVCELNAMIVDGIFTENNLDGMK